MRYGDLIMIKGFMLIAADTPMIGLDPHPAYAPDPVPEAFGASTWARLYHVDPDRAKLEQEAQDDLQAARDAVEEGDLEDCAQEADEVFPVSVSDGGVLTVMDPDGKYVMAEYTPEQVYGAFGMTAPEVLPDQRAAAWAVIRGQIVAIVSLDVPLRVARERNLERPDPVPDQVLIRLSEKREPPLPDEAHQVTSVDASGVSDPICFQTAREEFRPAPLP
jgi:hypothetical protein